MGLGANNMMGPGPDPLASWYMHHYGQYLANSGLPGPRPVSAATAEAPSVQAVKASPAPAGGPEEDTGITPTRWWQDPKQVHKFFKSLSYLGL